MSIISIFQNGQRYDDIENDLAAAIAIQSAPTDTRDILARNIDSMERALTNARTHAERLDAELQRVTEELRQTRLSVAAFEMAHGHMVGGRDV